MNRPARSSGAGWSVFAITLVAYIATMNRTIGFIDRGELAAAAATFGIPHPMGYPTLMLLAGALVRLSPLRPVLALNVFAALLTAAGAAVLCLLLDAVVGTHLVTASRAARSTLAACTALFVAFTTVWWQQANGFEVYDPVRHESAFRLGPRSLVTRVPASSLGR